jgi:hypothetical protein
MIQMDHVGTLTGIRLIINGLEESGGIIRE